MSFQFRFCCHDSHCRSHKLFLDILRQDLSTGRSEIFAQDPNKLRGQQLLPPVTTNLAALLIRFYWLGEVQWLVLVPLVGFQAQELVFAQEELVLRGPERLLEAAVFVSLDAAAKPEQAEPLARSQILPADDGAHALARARGERKEPCLDGLPVKVAMLTLAFAHFQFHDCWRLVVEQLLPKASLALEIQAVLLAAGWSVFQLCLQQALPVLLAPAQELVPVPELELGLERVDCS